MISSETFASDRIVLEHYLDQDSGNYRLVIGQQIIKRYISVPDSINDDGDPIIKNPDEEIPADEVIEIVNLQDFVFAGDDERWFDNPGVRKSDEDVAALQKQLIKDALAAAPDDAVNVSVPHVLPGVGSLL